MDLEKVCSVITETEDVVWEGVQYYHRDWEVDWIWRRCVVLSQRLGSRLDLEVCSVITETGK